MTRRRRLRTRKPKLVSAYEQFIQIVRIIHARFAVQSTRGDSKSIKSEGSTPTIVSISKSGSSQSTSEREIKRESAQPPARESVSSRSNDFKDEQSSNSASNNNTNNNNNGNSNGSQSERRSRELDREREREREERHSLSSTRSSQRDNNRSSNNKPERTEAEHQQRLRERTQRLEELDAAKRALKREKPTRRDERGQHRHDGMETVDLVTSGTSTIQEHRHYEEYDGRQRDRDLSSVSNESNGSLQHRHSHDTIEFDKGKELCLTLFVSVYL